MDFQPPHEGTTFNIGQIETALCIWEALDRRTLIEHTDQHPALHRWREDYGSYALRHAAIGLTDYVEAIYQAASPEDWDGLAFDWEIVPAILDWVSWRSPEPVPLLAVSRKAALGLAELLHNR